MIAGMVERRATNSTLFALMLAAIAYAVSQSSLQPALPALRADLHTTEAGANAVFSAFFVSGAINTVLLGRLGDVVGRRKMLLLVLAIFSAGSLVCAVAPSILVLIVGRIAMGAAAAQFPLAFATIRRNCRAKGSPRRSR
jgi:MFS family permease